MVNATQLMIRRLYRIIRLRKVIGIFFISRPPFSYHIIHKKRAAYKIKIYNIYKK